MRLIDADRFERVLLSMGEDNICNECCMSVIEKLDAQPTFEGIPSADVVEVVRCKNCADWDEGHYCRSIDLITKPDFYCSYGKRREEDE